MSRPRRVRSAVLAAGAALAAALILLPVRLSAQAPAPPDAGVDARAVLGPPRGQPLSGAALDARTAAVAALIRCPVCQGLSIGDSPTPMATNMRAQLRELLAQGYDDEQALSYFEASYGEFVRLKPPLRGVNWLVWLAPLGGLIAGALVVRASLRRLGGASPPPEAAGDAPSGIETPSAVPGNPPAAADPLPDDPELARYVLRVREAAYGWPGGVRPVASSASGSSATDHGAPAVPAR